MKPIDKLLDTVEWAEIPRNTSEDNCGRPWVTHEGVLFIGNCSLKVLQLSSGERVFDKDDFLRFFGFDGLEVM